MLELDPRIARAIASEPSGQIVAETLSAMRVALAKPSAPPSPGIERRDRTVAGEPPVAIRVHRPAGAEGPLPCVYSMHGGGYVLGSYAMDDARLDGWAGDLAGLPPAYICVGNVDGFRDDAAGYATRLNQAGVPAELHVYAGAPHGVKRFAGVPVARRYIEGIDDWIGAQLHPRLTAAEKSV
jgi:acetyl esterase/lipase